MSYTSLISVLLLCTIILTKIHHLYLILYLLGVMTFFLDTKKEPGLFLTHYAYYSLSKKAASPLFSLFLFSLLSLYYLSSSSLFLLYLLYLTIYPLHRLVVLYLLIAPLDPLSLLITHHLSYYS